MSERHEQFKDFDEEFESDSEEEIESNEQQQKSHVVDYYKVLKLKNRNCSQEDIIQAFRKLSRETHPDRAVHHAKQIGTIRTERDAEVLKQFSEKKQQLLNEAYETLSNPMKRAQYDIFGTGKKHALVPYTAFNDESEYRDYLKEKRRYENRQRKAADTSALTSTVISIDAQNTFNPESPLSIYNISPQRFKSLFTDPFFRITSSSIVNSFRTTIGDRDMIQFNGQASFDHSKQKPVHGVGLRWTHVVSPKKEDTTVSVNLSYNSSFGDHAFVTQSTLKTKLDEQSTMSVTWLNALIPSTILFNVFHTLGFIATYKRILLNDKTLLGKLTWSFTSEKYLALDLTKSFEGSQVSAQVTTGDRAAVTLGYQKQLTENDEEKSGALSLSTEISGSLADGETDCEYEVGIVRTLKKGNVGVGVSVGKQNGVNFNLSFSRERHQFRVPIQLCDTFDYRVALASVVVPLLGYFSVKRYIYTPLQRRWKRQSLYEQLRRDYEQTRAERERALEARESILQGAIESKLREEQIEGLVIINAQYGLQLDADEQITEQVEKYPPFIDVTDQLQFLVRDSALKLPEFPKCQLEGFYDPCPSSVEKTLVVTYSFRGRKHRVEVDDEEELIIPLEEDLLEDVSGDSANNNTDTDSD